MKFKKMLAIFLSAALFVTAFAGCGRLIRIQIEKHGQKGKKKRKAKRLI